MALCAAAGARAEEPTVGVPPLTGRGHDHAHGHGRARAQHHPHAPAASAASWERPDRLQAEEGGRVCRGGDGNDMELSASIAGL